MRIGTTTSVIGHVLLLGWGLVTLPNAQPFEIEQIDALPVDLVSIADVTQISEGTKTAPKRDTASQAEVKTPAPRPESQRAGNAPTEQDAPITEKTTDVAAAPTAEPPPPPPPPPAAPERPKEPPAPAAEAVPEPQPAAPETPPPPATTEVAELPAAPDEVPAEPAPTPVPPSAKPRAKPQAPDPIQTASVDPKPTPPSTETRRTETRKPAETRTETPPEKTEKPFDPNDLAALLNKVDPSGGGAKASDREASLGSERETGPVAQMTQSEIDALRAAITACWSVPAGADGVDGMVVPVRMQLNVDGSLAGDPVALQVPGGPFGTVMAESALRAVRRCAPYDFLPPEKYDNWKLVNINFDPREMF